MRNRRRVLYLQLLCLVMVVIGSCKSSYDNNPAPGPNPLAGDMKAVGVSYNGSAVVCDPDTVVVKKNMHRVVWTSADELKITLPAEFSQPECAKTGLQWRCVSKTFPNEGRVKYDASMNVSGSWKTVDPTIDVIPGP